MSDWARFLLFTHPCFVFVPQVIAIVMDMFTDVDILHDILTAAMRNVAVYIILDEQNAHHFANMVSNCRVNLQSFQVRMAFKKNTPVFAKFKGIPTMELQVQRHLGFPCAHRM